MNNGWTIKKILEVIPRIEVAYATTLSFLIMFGIVVDAKCKNLFYALAIKMRGIVKMEKNIS